MCVPKVPKTTEIDNLPQRASIVLPDNGDPSLRNAARNRRRLAASAMIFSNQSTLGAPKVSGPQGTTGL